MSAQNSIAQEKPEKASFGLICYAVKVSDLNFSYYRSRAIRKIWLVVCACLLSASVAKPIYAAQKAVPLVSLPLVSSAHVSSTHVSMPNETITVDMEQTGKSGTVNQHSVNQLPANQHLANQHSANQHSAIQHSANHQHHASGESHMPSDVPFCDHGSGCADHCAISTCCSVSSMSNAISNWAQAGHRIESIQRLSNKSLLITRLPDPLFRPPIR